MKYLSIVILVFSLYPAFSQAQTPMSSEGESMTYYSKIKDVISKSGSESCLYFADHMRRNAITYTSVDLLKKCNQGTGETITCQNSDLQDGVYDAASKKIILWRFTRNLYTHREGYHVRSNDLNFLYVQTVKLGDSRGELSLRAVPKGTLKWEQGKLVRPDKIPFECEMKVELDIQYQKSIETSVPSQNTALAGETGERAN